MRHPERENKNNANAASRAAVPYTFPKDLRNQIMGFEGPKFNTLNGTWDLKLFYLGSWTLRNWVQAVSCLSGSPGVVVDNCPHPRCIASGLVIFQALQDIFRMISRLVAFLFPGEGRGSLHL